MRELLLAQYQNRFDGLPAVLLFAPGRFNIIGEHLDYNGGQVLPGAMTYGTYVAAALRTDNRLVIWSDNLQDGRTLDLSGPLPAQAGWWRYVAGAVVAVLEHARQRRGMNVLLHGTLPTGAGLSSSASVTVGCALAAACLLHLDLTCRELALLSKQAENEFAGVPCGYLDPFAVACCRPGHALWLDCSNLYTTQVPVHLPDHEFIIVDSGTRRQLRDAPFQKRFEECQTALRVLERLLPVNFLAQVTPEQFDAVAHWIGDEVLYKRARHVVEEQARVPLAARYLRSGEALPLAELMEQSHRSLRDNFDASTAELEALISATHRVKGCLATRISGAGFGGCVLSLIERSCHEQFINEVRQHYRKETGLEAEFFSADFGPGARCLPDG